MRIAVYPGSFDPMTKGHLDIIERGSKMFDKLVVAILVNSSKTPCFTTLERMEMIEESVKHLDNVQVEHFEGLLVHYMEKNNYKYVLRGLRALADFENEFQMASMNKKLYPEIEVVILMTNIKYSFISSTLIREIIKFGGDLKDMVPELVYKKIDQKYGRVNDEDNSAVK
ncbi:pantetheine-phosphate adenylyltransferase [Alkalibacter saccharofermentans]|uniref:Phosphopantetheine adenylyltransferase n=1 Tax=Alkalibacter saccharofermentans DSM 14828 TaxID=1120975 RepID=A0A1M4S5B4_9FIRM|nr:pantetheine-phosphate adenylyltransferase [Alkalibacter saccharofermentans]SHE27398.1 Phosphopantetheine adenylyltransferase [Alkalibacter saccharofermentans DSM 14828]